jgi:glycosyltransferase involved in cell wall biosynthesis
MKQPFISICIPAYKRADYIKRLLDSISIQTYHDFDVIVTDDSPNSELKSICEHYHEKFKIQYFKNATNLNTPENWNEAIKRADGQWIKIMHDDDWFSSNQSLSKFAAAAQNQSRGHFIFSAYTNIYEETGSRKAMKLSRFKKIALSKEPAVLISDNVIGPPSVVMHINNGQIWYDREMKYIVDIDFYLHFLRLTSFHYINQSLINVGINKDQVTKYTFGYAEIHLKESLLLLEKTGVASLNNIIVYDGWWRLIRNFSIKHPNQLSATGFTGYIPYELLKIISFQKRIPSFILNTGVFSKILMGIFYSLKLLTK